VGLTFQQIIFVIEDYFARKLLVLHQETSQEALQNEEVLKKRMGDCLIRKFHDPSSVCN
jgi:hypothetical protein